MNWLCSRENMSAWKSTSQNVKPTGFLAEVNTYALHEQMVVLTYSKGYKGLTLALLVRELKDKKKQFWKISVKIKIYVPPVVTHRSGRKKSYIGTPLFLIFSSLSHFLVKPMTLYYAKIKSSKSIRAHIFWIGWLINEKSGCLCLRNSVLIYESLRYTYKEA